MTESDGSSAGKGPRDSLARENPTGVTGATLWDQFVTSAGADAAVLAGATGDAARLAALGHLAFRIGLSSLLLGAEDVGRLAIAIEQAIDRIAERMAGAGAAVTAELGAAIATLHDAFVQLAHADKSGARVENLPMEDRRRALDPGTATPPPGAATAHAPWPAAPYVAPSPASEPPHATTVTAPGGPAASAAGFAWTPSVDDDMIELFFDEATERVAALAGKLIEIERRPGDGELLRDVFRDLHTVKGSSAMVGLMPVNQLAHAAEDLVGQIRDSGRTVDGPVVDALLAALDGLRDMLGQARARRAVSVDPGPAVARLRNPGTPVPHPSTTDPGDREPSAATTAGRAAQATGDTARQTIRVDFDKLDRLLNLVGELVLGRDGLRGAVQALGSITTALAADRGVARRAAKAAVASIPSGLDHLGDDL
jgi:chemosensory pili system protein ChpA (sensor histidine kinase/response regulator)